MAMSRVRSQANPSLRAAVLAAPNPLPAFPSPWAVPWSANLRIPYIEDVYIFKASGPVHLRLVITPFLFTE